VKYSLRWRLPLLILVFISVVVATLVWVAQREVTASLVQAAGVRAQDVADQYADLLATSVQQRLAEGRRLAALPAVRGFLEHSSVENRAAAETALAAAQTTGATRVLELWTVTGQCVLAIQNHSATEIPCRPVPAPQIEGVDPLVLIGQTVFLRTVIAVARADTTPGPSDAHAPLGFLVVHRPMAAQNRDALNRLIGGGASMRLGNRARDVWTDLASAVTGPILRSSQRGLADYRTPNGDRRIGALAEVRASPWVVWVEFPESGVLVPARAFLRRMLGIALVFVLVGGLAVRGVTTRITTPLHDMTEASEAIAGGEYRRRVNVDRRDEIGRLGVAFNAMTERVQFAHRELEERVQQRTSRLAEAHAQLEERVRELSELRADLDRFFSLSLDMLCIAGMDGYFKRLNPVWQHLLGWTPEELTVAPYMSFVHPDDVERTMGEAAKLADGSTTVSFENRYRCKDGSYRWLSWMAAPFVERGLIYAVARDITGQRLTARQLEDRAVELAVVNEELEAFSYSVSHDLRAPLRHVSGFAMLLQETSAGALNEQGGQFLTKIIDASSRMGRLIDDLLAFSRVSRTALTKSQVDLNRLVHDVREEVMTSINGHEVVWQSQMLPTVDADPALLRLVFVNLLSNSLKYSATRQRSEIEVGTTGDGVAETVVFVRDNGVGFDPQYAHKLFGVFQRLHRTDEFEGTGIGLANVRRIVQRHGGRTWAASQPGEGATFFFSLPRQVG
jgi:PAS domain S-box-containing protein